MTKTTALKLLTEYANLCAGMSHPIAKDAARMPDRFPESGSVRKAMRWLGYMQGVMVMSGAFRIDQVKEHSRRGYVFADQETTI